MSVFYSKIQPLFEIARRINSLENRRAGETRKGARAELLAERRGLIEAASWVLMAQQEQVTRRPVPLLSNEETVTALAEYLKEEHEPKD